MNTDKVLALFENWNRALQTREAKNVVALYDSQAILLPTTSSTVHHGHKEIAAYFQRFLRMAPVATMDESNIRYFDQLAINAGLYTFTFDDESSLQARFTLVYHLENSIWKIMSHHSSRIPTQIIN